jgi:hypothetical protein
MAMNALQPKNVITPAAKTGIDGCPTQAHIGLAASLLLVGLVETLVPPRTKRLA